MNEHEILTLEEVAKYLRVSERTIYEWASKREIPCGKLGTAWRFKRSEIERWVDQKLGGKRPAPQASTVRLRDVLSPERVLLLDYGTKHEALSALIACLATAPEVRDAEELAREVFEREALMSTGIGFGIGVPHVRLASVSDLVLAVGIARQGLRDYASLDGQPVRIVCMVAAHENQHARYLRTLAAISLLMKNESLRERLLEAKSPEEIHRLFTEEA